MDTVISILHRMIGPIVLAIALTVLYLLTDSVSAYMSAVTGNFADAYTYHEGKPNSYELDAIDGRYVLATINNGSDAGSIIYIETNTGDSNVIYALVETTTGWQCTKSPVNYHVAEGETYMNIAGMMSCSLDEVRQSIKPAAEYEVSYEYGEEIGTTNTVYKCLI